MKSTLALDHKILENIHLVFGNYRLNIVAHTSPSTQEAETEAWPQNQGPPEPYNKHNWSEVQSKSLSRKQQKE